MVTSKKKTGENGIVTRCSQLVDYKIRWCW